MIAWHLRSLWQVLDWLQPSPRGHSIPMSYIPPIHDYILNLKWNQSQTLKSKSYQGEYLVDRNFSILPHDPFLDMAFPRPLRKNKIYKKRFFYFFAALKGVCGWPIDRQENSKRDCEVVSCCWALRTTCTCFIMICYCLKYFWDYILYVQTKKWCHIVMKSSLTGWLWVQQVEQWEDDHRQTEELFQGDKKVIS